MKLFKIKKSKIDNNGLYANQNIKKGTKIIEYKGKIISVKQSEVSSKFDNGKAIYLFNINKKYDLDGDFKFMVLVMTMIIKITLVDVVLRVVQGILLDKVPDGE